MNRTRTGLLLAGVLCLALSSPTTYAQDITKLEKSNAAGVKAYRQGRYAEAEPLYQRSLAFREKALGPDHPDVG